MTDPRARPVRLRPGVAHLAPHLKRGVIVPLALEYPFWEEKHPEALACFGEPMRINDYPAQSAKQWQAHLTERLERAMDRLSALAIERDPATWRTLMRGRVGTSATYDAWRALRARLRGERFSRGHGEAIHGR